MSGAKICDLRATRDPHPWSSAIILNCGAVFNKVLHARLPFALLGAIPTTWVLRFLNVDMVALGFHGGARRGPILVNLTR